MIVASFDIGKKNFAFYLEEFDRKKLNQKLVFEFEKDGKATEQTSKHIDNQIYLNGKTVLHRNYNLETCENNEAKKRRNKKKKLTHEDVIFYNLVTVLDKYHDYWKRCQCIIIEQQMSFGSVLNLTAIKLAQHCFSYFCIKYATHLKHRIFNYPAYYKTQLLGAPKVKGNRIYKDGSHNWKAMSKPTRKKWAITEATRVLELRGEKNLMSTHKKKDDLADTLLQLQSFKVNLCNGKYNLDD